MTRKPRARSAEEALARILETYPKFFFGDGGFIGGGDKPTIADIRLACTLEFLAVADTELPDLGDGVHEACRVHARGCVQRAGR